jgi:urease accessory protein UreF
MFVISSLKGVLSASVRLGTIGPVQAQRMQAKIQKQIMHTNTRRSDKEQAAVPHATPSFSALDYFQLPLADVHSTHPLMDVMHTAHDRLFMRLFNS